MHIQHTKFPTPRSSHGSTATSIKSIDPKEGGCPSLQVFQSDCHHHGLGIIGTPSRPLFMEALSYLVMVAFLQWTFKKSKIWSLILWIGLLYMHTKVVPIIVDILILMTWNGLANEGRYTLTCVMIDGTNLSHSSKQKDIPDSARTGDNSSGQKTITWP